MGRTNHLLSMDDELLRLTPLLRARPFIRAIVGFRPQFAIGFLRTMSLGLAWLSGRGPC
jgi:hypothetical protein